MLARDYKIRVCIVFFCFVALFLIIGVRLFLIQIYQKNFFKILARHQYEIEVTTNQPRAAIYDRTGKNLLAFNKEVPSAFVVPQQLTDKDQTMKFLTKYYPVVAERIKTNPEKQFLWVDRKLDTERYKFLSQKKLKDIYFIAEPQRFYSLPEAAQIVGFTDIDNQGIAGIEHKFTEQLAGRPTRLKVEKDARSGVLYFEKKTKLPGNKGQDIQLTIDTNLQVLAYHELEKTVMTFNAKAGSIVIMDAVSGHVLAMANYPNFNPNQKAVPSLELMKNSILSECFELGSVMKVFCALAALEEKEIALDDLIDCEGKIAYIDGFRVENPTIRLARLLEERNNIITFFDVIRYSSNVGIAKVAKRLGGRLYLHLRRLGFGEKTGIEFPGERNGFVNPPEQWTKSSPIVLSFGYEIMASLLQLARAFCIIANDGFDVTPTLVIDRSEVKKKIQKKLYSDRSIEQLKTILRAICEKHQIEGFDIWGKTGTARCLEDGQYTDKVHRHVFAGIVEKEGYKRVIVTFIREPEKSSLWASEVAMPLFDTVAQKMIVHDLVHTVVRA